MNNEIEKCKSLLKGSTFEAVKPQVFFKSECAVFEKDERNSLCYTTSEERAELLASILNEWAGFKGREKSLLKALTIFTDCPDWRRHVHEMDCTDPGGHNDPPEEMGTFPNCHCDGPYNVEVIEAALEAAGSPVRRDIDA